MGRTWKYPWTFYKAVRVMSEQIKSKTGKPIDEISLQEVEKGAITSEDLKISSDTLRRQAAVAQENGRPQLKDNFLRASELINVPDDVLLSIYNALRPHRSTKQQLLDISSALRNVYKAQECAAFVEDAAAIYEKRGILRTEG
jgi:propanediol dehydratase small subunit